jgi:endonuclease/exonuclease/phosphatase family metal-dependent hydrolase
VNRPSASRLSALAILVAAFAFALLPALAAAKPHGLNGHHGNGHRHAKSQGHGHHGQGHGRGKEVRVMTRNLYLGADLGPAIGTESLQELAEANGNILNQVTANDFPTRAKGLAAEILEKHPDLVGLQEVALWRTAPPSIAPLQTGPSATTVRYDYLQELLDELDAGKGPPPYRVVVVQQEFDLEAPADENGEPGDGPAAQGIPDAEINGRLTMRDVILARTSGGVHTWNAEGDNFETLLRVPILGQQLPIARGWTSTDARVRGSHPFRFVNTHLEAFQPEVRAAQAAELVAPDGPATSDLPVVLVGDLNSDDDTVTGADTLAYGVLLKAGLVERSTDDPLSCCIDSPLLAVGAGGSIADFDHQVDHVMTRDPDEVTLDSSAVTGLQPVNGFWNSDHAGLFSALRFAR